MNTLRTLSLALMLITASISFALQAQPPAVPAVSELNAPFSTADKDKFLSPPMVYHPETWFHYIDGNVAKNGITADLEALAYGGFSGIQLFHGGQFGGGWPGVEPQIYCLSPEWDDHIRYTAEECRRLGLRFTMQNCPGWSMAGGPWIQPENAMRELVWSRTDIDGNEKTITLPRPQPSNEEWRDYRDIAVIAFPTPLDDTGSPLVPQTVKSDTEGWAPLLSGESKTPIRLAPSTDNTPHWIEVAFSDKIILRTIEFSSVDGFNHNWCFEPGITVKVQAIFPEGKTQEILNTPMPQASWQDPPPISLSCNESNGTTTYRVTITNAHDMTVRSLRFYSAARKNNWESEAGWTLRSIVRINEHPQQSPESFVKHNQIVDISSSMDKDGNLNWQPPAGKWTVLRIGNVNSGKKNSPAPKEATGFECNKLSETGSTINFANYIGRLADGPLAGGLLNGMLLDSWECNTQTWTANMEEEFAKRTDYQLRTWLPAVFGYVVDDHETTSRFLRDWRGVIGDLFANKFYGQMATLAKEKNINIQYETAAGDVVPADIMEYYKYADVPMTEFWQPYSDNFVGSINFKPIKPTASAARMYGKPRIAAEAFTSFALTWDEHLSMLKEVANLNCVEGVTHLVFHTYTHNPRTDWLPPGTSFGSRIGTPFLRGQTWWKHIPEFTTYLSRLNYMFERGIPVSDILWYLGDEIDHKPDQRIEIKGYKYDYCNPDVLLHRLAVKDGKIVTPEGISYRVLWIPDNERMLPETLEKLVSFAQQGAVIVGNAPKSLATLAGGQEAQRRFDAAVKELWESGKVMSGITIEDALTKLNIHPDISGGNALWLHRKTENADWYYVAAPYGEGFNGSLNFNCNGYAEIWDPVTGEITPADAVDKNGQTIINFDLARAGSCFVIFRKDINAHAQHITSLSTLKTKTIAGQWTLLFPSGWGAPASIKINELKAWKDLDLSPEGKAFSGTATYTTTFDADKLVKGSKYLLDLGTVEMIAVVRLNGKKLRTLWTPPYSLDITEALKPGKNELQVEVTSTWFNRLVYDANQPESERKTWTIGGPSKDEPLRVSGLLGPIVLHQIE